DRELFLLSASPLATILLRVIPFVLVSLPDSRRPHRSGVCASGCASEAASVPVASFGSSWVPVPMREIGQDVEGSADIQKPWVGGDVHRQPDVAVPHRGPVNRGGPLSRRSGRKSQVPSPDRCGGSRTGAGSSSGRV